jgi:hypothetical protein
MSSVIIAGPPLGFQLSGRVVYKCINETGAQIDQGEVGAMDLAGFEAEVLNFLPGSEGSGLAILTVTAAGPHLLDGTAPIGMAMADVPDGEAGEFLFRGKPPFSIIVTDAADASTTPGHKLICVAATNVLDTDPASTGRIVGFPLIVTATAIATPIPVFFNGLDWLGAT